MDRALNAAEIGRAARRTLLTPFKKSFIFDHRPRARMTPLRILFGAGLA